MQLEWKVGNYEMIAETPYGTYCMCDWGGGMRHLRCPAFPAPGHVQPLIASEEECLVAAQEHFDAKKKTYPVEANAV